MSKSEFQGKKRKKNKVIWLRIIRTYILLYVPTENCSDEQQRWGVYLSLRLYANNVV